MSTARAQNSGIRSRNPGHLSVVRGGLYTHRPSTPRRHGPPDQWLDREMRAVFAALHAPGRAIPSRGIYDAAEGYQWPWRKIAKRFREARDGGTPVENVRAVLHLLEQHVEALYAQGGDRAA